ncbi:MAG: radical SAM protein [Gallionellales bacterium RIFCSPLOWO2_12_FULL_57_18]|nr:MAG: radical SAM protein [Gallionellales bacterium RIFCSPLOWO2_12_FULL_57_18]OGS96518.1 MAG: radical SAM protein [Gallionellales bacterium RIFCSPLOWO2_02_FULL_57_47]OGT10324.1 MAG: radical SAM protein [Gallionellales bacterium RIFCSPHIGHO2_02_FULL_57_16]
MPETDNILSVTNHDRGSAALRYVYPVISRRAGSVSVGINLNPNNACNWRCIYCQVPDLTRGTAPPVDLAVLENELRGFLNELLHGDFMKHRVPEGLQRINDIALSGNGEPTSSAEFAQVIELIARVRGEVALPETVKTVLITNGSLLYRSEVQQGLRAMAKLNGEVWFKLDRASEAGMQLINNTSTGMGKVRDNLVAAIALCPTWLQTCWFALDGKPPSRQDEDDYLEFVSALLRDGHKPQGVLLYGLARPSMQAEAPRLSALPEEHLQAFAGRIGKLGLPIKVSV